MSACLKGEVPERMLNGDYEGAKNAALKFSEIFQDRFYLEVQNHGIPEEEINIENMKKLSKVLKKVNSQGDMVPVPRKLTKGLRLKLYEGRYDQETLMQSRFIVNVFKANFGKPTEESSEGNIRGVEYELDYMPSEYMASLLESFAKYPEYSIILLDMIVNCGM